MPPPYDTTQRNALADAAVDALNVGSGPAHATLRLFDSGVVQLASLALAVPVAPAASGGAKTFSAIPAGVVAASARCARYELRDRAGSVVLSGPVADLGLTSAAFKAGDTLRVTDLVYAVAADGTATVQGTGVLVPYSLRYADQVQARLRPLLDVSGRVVTE